jgi:hypothetical protein
MRSVVIGRGVTSIADHAFFCIRPGDIRRGNEIRITVSESHGNALGIGLADAITGKIFDAIDAEKMYPNCITSTDTVMLSESYYEDVAARKYSGLKAIDEPQEMLFDAEGNVITKIRKEYV